MVCSSLGKIFFLSFMTYWGTNVDSTHEEVLSTPRGKFSSQLLRRLPLGLGPMGESFHDAVLYWAVSLVIYDLLRDVLDAFNPLGMF